MKQVLDWLREQMRKHIYTDFTETDSIEFETAISLVDEAEAKWESEFVRCKDCKHWEDVDTNWCTEHVKFCNIGTYAVGENGYCVYGERKPIKISEVK